MRAAIDERDQDHKGWPQTAKCKRIQGIKKGDIVLGVDDAGVPESEVGGGVEGDGDVLGGLGGRVAG